MWICLYLLGNSWMYTPCAFKSHLFAILYHLFVLFICMWINNLDVNICNGNLILKVKVATAISVIYASYHQKLINVLVQRFLFLSIVSFIIENHSLTSMTQNFIIILRYCSRICVMFSANCLGNVSIFLFLISRLWSYSTNIMDNELIKHCQLDRSRFHKEAPGFTITKLYLKVWLKTHNEKQTSYI